MPQLAVTTIGVDRPGLITRTTGVLRRIGADLADSTSTILGGHCVTVLLVDVPEGVDPEGLQADLAAEVTDLDLAVWVQEVGSGSPSMPATHVLNVHGPDRPGILHDVASLLADRGVNVTDAAARVLHGEQPVYALQLEIAVGDQQAAEELVGALRAWSPDVEVHTEPLEVATF